MSLEPQKVLDAFDKCSGLNGAELEEAIRRECGNDNELRTELEALLEADSRNLQDQNYLDWFQRSNPSNLLEPNTRVGDYFILQTIGSGTFGEVYQARSSDDSEVAVKILRPWMSHSQNIIRFRREAEALSRIDHPNVAKLVQVGIHEDKPYLVTEFVDATPLNEKLKDASQHTVRQKIEWLLEACKGVAEIHSHSILHRDLKPSNLLIRDNGSVVVTDLGVAKFLQPGFGQFDTTATGEFIGTPKYMAPEQLQEDAELSFATDVFGLGAVMYLMLTGREPFDGTSLVEVVDAVRHRDPESPSRLDSNIPRDLSTICLRCLNKEPQHRYASAAELAAELDRWLTGKPISARPKNSVERAIHWARKNRTASSLCIAMMLFFVGGIFATSYFNIQSKRQKSRLLQTIAEFTTAEQKAAAESRDRVVRRGMLEVITQTYQELEQTEGLDSKQLKASGVAWLKLGRLSSEKAEKKEALEFAIQKFRELKRRHPENLEYDFDIVHCLLPQRKFKEALPIMQRLIDKEPNNHSYLDVLSFVLLGIADDAFKTGEYLDAIKHHTMGEQISLDLVKQGVSSKKAFYAKNVAIHRLQRFRSYVMIGKNKEAIKDLIDAVEGFRDCRESMGKDPELFRNEIAALLRLTSCCLVENAMDSARGYINQADEVSVEYLTYHPSVNAAFELRSSTLLHRAMIAAIQNDEQSLFEINKATVQLFEHWETSGIHDWNYVEHLARHQAINDYPNGPNPAKSLQTLRQAGINRCNITRVYVELLSGNVANAKSTFNKIPDRRTKDRNHHFEKAIDAIETGREPEDWDFYTSDAVKERKSVATGAHFTNVFLARKLQSELKRSLEKE